VRCFLCKNWAQVSRYRSINFQVECEACGNYIISHPVSLNYRGHEEHMPVVDAYKTTSYIKRRTLLGEEAIFIVTGNTPTSTPVQKTVEQLERSFPKRSELFYLAILNLTLAARDSEGRIALNVSDYPLLYCSSDGMSNILHDLVRGGYISGYYGVIPCTISVTREAWEYAEERLSIEKEGVIRLEEMKKMREKFLMAVYEATKGEKNVRVNMFEIGSHLGLSNTDTNRIFDYLEGEGLLKARTLGGGIGITHEGVKTAERGFISVDSPLTGIKPTYNIINNINSPSAQVGINSTLFMQYHESSPIIELVAFVSKLKEIIPALDLDEDEKEAVESDLKVFEKQLSNSEPDPVKVKSRFRTLMENLTEKVAVQTIAGQFPTVMKWMKELFNYQQ
jgi:hypothetical protein